MALLDHNSTSPVCDPASVVKIFHDGEANGTPPFEALLRLSALRHQAVRDLHLSQFLAHTPRFCVVLMLAGAAVLGWGPAHESDRLAVDFVWAVSLLIGIVFMTRATIQGFACSPSPVPLETAAFELRMLLVFTGVAWGGGAFLMSPALPVLVFAAVPCLTCALILPCEKGVIAFIAPVTVLTALAALLRQPDDAATAAMILVAGAAIAAFVMLRRVRRRASLPGLALP